MVCRGTPGRRREGQAAVIAAVLLFCGCAQGPAPEGTKPLLEEREVFVLKAIAPGRAKQVLAELGLGTVEVSSAGTVTVAGPAETVRKAGIVLDLIDSSEPYVGQTLAPLSAARGLATNDQIARALGGISIGTFAAPPGTAAARGIIDIHGDSVVAIIPGRLQKDLAILMEAGLSAGAQAGLSAVAAGAQAGLSAVATEVGPTALRQARGDTVEQPTPRAPAPEPVSPLPVQPVVQTQPKQEPAPAVQAKAGDPKAGNAPAEAALSRIAQPPVARTDPSVDEPKQTAVSQGPPRQARVPPDPPARPTTSVTFDVPTLANGEDILELELPDRLEMTQLLDLAAEYLSLDYLFDPEKLRGQSVSLRLHGKLQGQVRVKDLYALLESVLKFKGLAMTSHRAGLVTIVPVADALDVDPALVGPEGAAVTPGDMVVTRVFSLRHVNTASAMNLLNNLRLSVSAAPIAETGTLIVTCYAYRMARIEQLLDLVDRPGSPKEFRYRPLRYTMAGSLAAKVEALAAELQTVPVKVTATPAASPVGSSQVGSTEKSAMPSLLSGGSPSGRPAPGLGSGSTGAAVESTDKDTVYLDVDERTNRLLMIGQADQLAIVEEVIDALDVEQSDLRTLRTYPIVHMTAGQAKRKLEDLDVLGKAGPDPSGPGATSLFSSKTEGGSRDKGERVILQETQVTVLESTNSLLINATPQQHSRIRTVLAQVDVAPEDLRILKTYDIRYVDASEVKKKLAEFGFIGEKARQPSGPVSAQAPASTSPAPAGEGDGSADQSALLQETQVSVLDATNSLLINATEFAHTQMARVIQCVDAEVRQEAIPYEIYFLENQDPDALAEVLGRLIAETVKDKEAKVEKVVRSLEDEILIVPDKGTFSLVVYATRTNQEWISKLIKTLDRRRPQVLIDVTLVEIRKTDQFNYDLNLVGSLPDMTQTSGQTGSFMVDEHTTVPEKLLEPGSRRQFIDFQANAGTGTGFYADLHINALLTAMQTKNYGRVLAKPKVLVNDNEKGIIKTTDTTYVEKKSSIPVSSGTAGQQTNLIETAIDYQSYEAGITMEITPHISEGQLLRLEITLTRSDFGTITRDRPPDLTASDVQTVVTVPDGSTIILGGMLKLNQTKGGTKVPILGDLPLVGGAFRGISNSDVQSKLYVFVRAEVIRPAEAVAGTQEDLKRISDRDRASFERHEQEFQGYEDWPGVRPKPTTPSKVLDAR